MREKGDKKGGEGKRKNKEKECGGVEQETTKK